MHVRCHLREFRAALRNDDGTKVSIEQLARRCGVSGGNLSMLERGMSLPLDRHLEALETAYGQTIDAWYDPRLLPWLERDPEDDR
jgi:transcriptional regulator with XRE-family HTH domain